MSPIGRRRALFAGVIALTLMASSAPALPPAPEDMSLGSPKAPVTVIEFASLGCSHCAVWAKDVFPAFKAKYIDTGKVRFVMREMLNGDATLATAGFLTARCAPRSRYFEVVEAVFAQQDAIGQNGGSKILAGIAKDAGVDQARFTACLKDEAAIKALRDRADRATSRDKVSGTPTFIVGGKILLGEQTLAELDAAIAQAVKGGKPRAGPH